MELKNRCTEAECRTGAEGRAYCEYGRESEQAAKAAGTRADTATLNLGGAAEALMPLVFWTEQFFRQVVDLVNSHDATKALSGIETSLLLKCDDRGEAFVVRVVSGYVSVNVMVPEDRHEFTLTTNYDEWVRIAKGEEKVQAEIVKGKVRFTGPWPKMLLYINKVVRLEREMLESIGKMTIEY